MTRLCNMTYTSDDGTTQRICQDGNPRKAIRSSRTGAYVCQACWPEVLAKLSQQQRGPPAFVRRAIEMAFKRI